MTESVHETCNMFSCISPMFMFWVEIEQTNVFETNKKKIELADYLD